jgi:uncharacterized damage-inducible protein DinB
VTVRIPFPEPTSAVASRPDVFLGYLDYFRDLIVDKLDGLDDAELRRSRLPSGWSPLSLAKHLTNVERRWLIWGFEGRDVPDPWADERDGRWFVEEGESVEEVILALRQQGETTRRVVERHALDEVGRPGPRWDGATPATLERVLFHLLQEYARHAGQLDIVREMLDGTTGE